MKRLLIFCGFILLSFSAKSQIIAGEYFWDTDPGAGLGIQLSPGDIATGVVSENFNFNVTTPTISLGQHVLFVRFKQNDTLWSQAFPQMILVGPSNTLAGSTTAADTAKVDNFQYYWNTDVGNVFSSAVSNYDAQFNFQSSFSNTGLPVGNHTLNYRVRDKFGLFSPWAATSILVLGDNPNITKIEHWLDDKAVIPRTSDPFTPAAASDVSSSFEIPTSGLSNGLHVFNTQAISATRVVTEKSGSDSSAISQVAILVDPQYTLTAGATFLSNNTASSEFCLGGKIKLKINQTGAWLSQNQFKLQLSDNTGSNFVDIITTINGTQDTLIGTVPSNLVVSSGYKIRAVSTYPYIRSESATVLKLGITTVASATQTTLCEGTTLQLSSVTSTAASYSWSGPSGFTSIITNPTRTDLLPSHAGSYILTATSIAAGCVAKDTVDIIVNTLPIINRASNTPVCEGQTLNLTSSSTGNTLLIWTKGGVALAGSGANRSILNMQMANAGYYKVGYQSPAGCQKFDSVNVVVKITPFISGLVNNSPVCEGVAVNVGVNTFPSATYEWTGPNAFTNSTTGFSFNSAQSLANKSGTYKVKAILNGCADSTTTLLTINALPIISMSSNTPLCVGQTLNLTSNATGNSFLSWVKGNSNIGGISGSKTISNVILADSGYYKVGYLSSASCLKIDSIKVVIKENPTISNTSTNAPICSGQNLVVSSTVTAGSTLSWTGPNAFSNSNAVWSITAATVAASGTYTLSVMKNGCSTSTTVVNVVNQTPTVTTTSPVNVCEGQNLQLNVNNTPSATYLWSGPFFASAVQNPVVSTSAAASHTGTYTVNVTLATCSASGTVDVSVNPNPVLVITNQNANAGGSIDLTLGVVTSGSTLPSGSSLTYFTNAGATISLPSPNNVTVSGTYYIKAITLSGCIDIKPIVVSICGGTFDPITAPISTGAVVNVSNQKVTATNIVSGVGTRATYKSALHVELKPGFKADAGSIFMAEIAGCN